MPTYDYQCENEYCQHAFEYIQGMNDDKLVTCPECGKDTLIRLIGAGSGVIFKGEGFHCNDYNAKTKNVRDKSVSKDERIGRRKKALKKLKDFQAKGVLKKFTNEE